MSNAAEGESVARGEGISRASGGRIWWAHFEFTRMNIEPTILCKKIEERRVVRAFASTCSVRSPKSEDRMMAAGQLNVSNHRIRLRWRPHWLGRDRLPLMDDWFDTLAAGHELSSDAAGELCERGFVVLPGALPSGEMDRVRRAYDAVVASAAADDVKVGSTTTRVNDFVNRGVEFDAVYVFPPLLEACCRIIGQPFKLSSLHARTLQPHLPVSELHVDVRRDSADWPLAGFILMIDEFRPDNGATRFVPGSHRWPGTPEEVLEDRRADHDDQLLACGPAGSMLVFNGSAWQGHTANTTGAPRRSVQGAFIPWDGRAGTNFSARLRPETRARIGPLAKYVLAV